MFSFHSTGAFPDLFTALGIMIVNKKTIQTNK